MVQASPDLYAEQELRSSCLAKQSDPIAKHIIKVSSYSKKYDRTIPHAGNQHAELLLDLQKSYEKCKYNCKSHMTFANSFGGSLAFSGRQ